MGFFTSSRHVDPASLKTTEPVNFSDAQSITKVAKNMYGPVDLDTDLGKNITDSFNKVNKSPTERNAKAYAHSLSEAAATEAGGLNPENAEMVKSAITTALEGAGVSEADIKKAIKDGFTTTAYTKTDLAPGGPPPF